MSKAESSGPLSGRMLQLGLGAVGVVFGDIGTSPLYAVQQCFSPEHGLQYDAANVLGVLSLVFWAIMIVVTFKYALFIMRADNHGEGGVMSLLALVMDREGSGRRTAIIVVAGLIGTGLLLADGMITPAISVISALEGIKLVAPTFTPWIVPLAAVILAVLFLFQRRGTAKIGQVFGPVMMVWFAVIALLGLSSILRNPGVFAAVNPDYAVAFFMRHGPRGFLILGSVVLAITGAEALYADIGHFGKSPIRMSWFAFVLPALILNYFGQGAVILREGAAAAANPFYALAPAWFQLPLVFIATAATIIASQALITGAFSLVHQAVQLGYLPKLRIIHTSSDMQGQIYVPLVNTFLMVACIMLVLFFRTSDALASAYGIAVTGTMICTNILFFVVARSSWNWKLWQILPLCILFMVVDCSFFSMNLVKVFSGGWIPLLAGAFFLLIMQTWKWGTRRISKFMAEGSIPLDALLADLSAHPGMIGRIPGTAVFMTGNPANRLSVLLHHLKHNHVLHEQVILLTVITESVPYTEISRSLSVNGRGEGFYEVKASYGYMQSPDIHEIVEYLNAQGFKLDVNSISYFVGRVSLRVEEKRRGVPFVARLMRFMHRNSEPATDWFKLPPGRVVELGTQIPI